MKPKIGFSAADIYYNKKDKTISHLELGIFIGYEICKNYQMIANYSHK